MSVRSFARPSNLRLVEKVANAIRPTYQRFFGVDAPLAAIPLDLLRRAVGAHLIKNVDGVPLKIDLRDYVTAYQMVFLGSYEPVETALVRAIIKPGDVVVDVGANIGYFTVLMGNIVGPSGCVFAIEPDDANFELLTDNVKRNGLGGNTILKRIAAGGTNGNLRLYKSRVNFGDHRVWTSHIHSSGEREREFASVGVIPLDSLVGSDRRIDFVKIDVQGYEPAVIAGLTRAFSERRISAMLVEFWPAGMTGAGFNPSAFLRALFDYGLSIWQVHPKQLEEISEENFGESFQPSQYVNLFIANRDLMRERLDDLLSSFHA